MRDPYEILGVQRTDDEAAIKAAYRSWPSATILTSIPASRGGGALQGNQHRLRPAVRQGEARPLRPRRDRRRGPRGAAAAPVLPRLPAGSWPGALPDATAASPRTTSRRSSPGFGQGAARPGRPRRGLRRPGRDLHYGLTLSFLDAANGTTRRLRCPTARPWTSDPAGTEDGHMLRLRGQGGLGIGGGASR